MRFPCYRKATLDLVHSGSVPNVTGMGSSPRYEALAQFDSGAMAGVRSSTASANVSGNNVPAAAQGINASLSNSIYGSSQCVQPRAFQVLMIIKS